jgi:rubrerythrin
MKEKKNLIEGLTNSLVENLKYSDSSASFPNTEAVKGDDGVLAEWFYNVHNGLNASSELSTIHMYTTQQAMFDEIGTLTMGIAITEMQHKDKLSDLILSLGGEIKQKWNNSNVVFGSSPEMALDIAIRGEKQAIEDYKGILRKVMSGEPTPTKEICRQFLLKLIADENLHETLLKESYKNLTGNDFE